MIMAKRMRVRMDKDERKVVRLREKEELSWRKIGRRMKLSHEQCRLIYYGVQMRKAG